jgi:hypothetical protein
MLEMNGALPPLSIIFYLYRRKTLHSHNTELFCMEVCSVEREKVVFSGEAESLIFGSIPFGITSPTSEVLL